MKEFMKKNQFFTYSKLCTLALAMAGGLFLASCAEDGYDDETFDSGVYNSQLGIVDAEGITVTKSADEKSQTFTWPVVMGAGGYLVSLYDTDNIDEPVVKDSIVDGCTMTAKRAEDTNYRLTIQTLGNEQRKNTGSSELAVLEFNTFSPALATIPDGTDLYEYFTNNEIPDSNEVIYYDLEPGGHYTLSGVVDFNSHNIALRTTSHSDLATITYGKAGGLEYCGGLKLKYLNFDLSATTNPTLAFSAKPDPSILDAAHNNHHQITEPTTIQFCHFEGVRKMFLYDNKVKYCLKTFLMEESTVHFVSEGMSAGSLFYIYDGGGFINDFTLQNSTLWNTGEAENYMIRYNNSGRCDRAGYTSNSINFINCTLYNIAKSGQMCNHGGFDGRSTSNYEIRNNIFVDCGNGAVPRRITGRISTAAVNNFDRNTYWFNGKAETEGAPDSVEGATKTYDQSGTALQSDPALVDPDNGNFTPTGEEQLLYKTGDPRWLP